MCAHTYKHTYKCTYVHTSMCMHARVRHTHVLTCANTYTWLIGTKTSSRHAGWSSADLSHTGSTGHVANTKQRLRGPPRLHTRLSCLACCTPPPDGLTEPLRMGTRAVCSFPAPRTTLRGHLCRPFARLNRHHFDSTQNGRFCSFPVFTNHKHSDLELAFP